MLTRLSSAILATLVFAGCGAVVSATDPEAVPKPVGLELVWRLGGLANPESAALSADGAFLYVTNVNGEGEDVDGNGFISRISVDGKMLERNWSIGLDGPKGIARDKDTLYVADITQLVVIEAATGKPLSRIPLEGATFLNDVAITPDGRVLVADSGGKRIYAVADGRPSVWIENELLSSINGLLVEPARLIVTTMAGRLLAIDYASGAITVLAEGLGDGAAAGEFLDGVGKASGVELGFQRFEARIVRRMSEGGDAGEELLRRCAGGWPDCAGGQAEQRRWQHPGQEFHDASDVSLSLFPALRQSN